MTSLNFTENDLQSVLDDWPESCALLYEKTAQDGLLSRIQKCLIDIQRRNGNTTFYDLIVLIRQLLLSKVSSSSAPWIVVPMDSSWPSSNIWQDLGFEVAHHGSYAQVKPLFPRLQWMEGQQDLFDEAFKCVKSRLLVETPADPILRFATGLPSYTGPGQREAIRALMHLPSDVTLIANLPTGSGKSLLAQLPPLLDPRNILTLVIVPTIALAIDQGKRMAKLFLEHTTHWQDRPLSFHSGLSDEERSRVFRSLRNGEQRILFTSPEAATGSLRNTLVECAALGSLSHVVIDEAHIVVTWGSGFRPAFQLLPALVSSLRAANRNRGKEPFRVILASATLTKHTIESLQALFAGSGEHRVVSGVYVRPEPRYGVKKVSEMERIKHVLEAVQKAPRPFILYVTRPDEAEAWLTRIREFGFGRVACFTGETSSDRRKVLLDDWDANKLDGMVATSAFGLGVDKTDVRTVIHATLPESLDRFYQEVGRSGRDGNASASLLVFTEEDVGQARSMSTPRLIGNELGYDHWVAMLNDPDRPITSDGQIWLDLITRRPALFMKSKANRTWNLRTLNLMATAGIIEIVELSGNPGNSSASAPDVEYNDSQVAYAGVKILIRDLNLSIFESRMNSARESLREASKTAFELMYQVAIGEVEIGKALVALYGLSLKNLWADVVYACGGCKSHWGEHKRSLSELVPFVSRIDRFSDRKYYCEELVSFPKEQANLIFIVVADLANSCVSETSAFALMLQKIRPHTLVVSSELGSLALEKIIGQMVRTRSDTFIDRVDFRHSTELHGSSQEVRFILWTNSLITVENAMFLRSSDCAMTVVFIDQQLADPNRPDRAWVSTLVHVEEERAYRRLSQ